MTLALEPVLPGEPLPLPLRLRRTTVEQYHYLTKIGFLQSGDPIELLEGLLVEKMPKNPPHRVCTRRIRVRLEALMAPGWYVDAQEPITTADSEPEPDVSVIYGDPDALETHPLPHQVALVVEVSESSLRQDQTLKKRLYARAGIPQYWIANLIEMQLEVYTDPQSALESPDYASVRIYRPGEQIPFTLEGQTHQLEVSALLP